MFGGFPFGEYLLFGSLVCVVLSAQRMSSERNEGDVKELYEQRAVQLWSYARRLGLSTDAAEDAVQEAFARLIRASEGRTPERPEAWLFRTVHNLAMDEHRRSRQRDTSIVRQSASSVAPMSFDARTALWDAVDRLPKRQRAVLYLRYRASLDFHAISFVLGIAEGSARSTCFQALRRLRVLLGDR